MDPADTAYNLSGTLRLDGTVDADALHRASWLPSAGAMMSCARESGRSTARRSRSPPTMPGFGWAESDLADVAPAQQPAALDDLVRTASTAPFDLETGPCFRVHLIRLSDPGRRS